MVKKHSRPYKTIEWSRTIEWSFGVGLLKISGPKYDIIILGKDSFHGKSEIESNT